MSKENVEPRIEFSNSKQGSIGKSGEIGTLDYLFGLKRLGELAELNYKLDISTARNDKKETKQLRKEKI